MRTRLLIVLGVVLTGCVNETLRLRSDADLVRDGMRVARDASYWCFVPTVEQYRQRLDARLRKAARQMVDLGSNVDITGALANADDSDKNIVLSGCKRRSLTSNSDLRREVAIVKELEYRVRHNRAQNLAR